MELKNKIAIITGASSGIGLAAAKFLLDKNCFVYGLNRREAAINHPNYFNIKCDIRNFNEVEKAVLDIEAQHNEIHILINNAGLGYFGKIDEMSNEQWLEMFDVNVHGLFYCIKTVAKVMKKNQMGHIINISSIAGKQAVVEGSGYSATKFAVRAIGESIFRELRNFNIKVSTIFPGSTNTEFFSRITHTLKTEDMIQPEDLAQSIIEILESNADYLPFELEVRTMRAR